MRGWLSLLVGLISVAVHGAATDGPNVHFPQIARYGGVVPVPGATEPPRRGTKIVFDITADGKPEQLNQGLESVARYLNLNASAGFKPSEVKLALVLHGPATLAALNDGAYAKHTASTQNPNLELIRELKACGVELFVCGQSLARNNFSPAEVTGELSVAASAMTVNANKQLDGYSYLSIR